MAEVLQSHIIGTLYVAVNLTAVLAFVDSAVGVYGDGRAAFGTLYAELCLSLLDV